MYDIHVNHNQTILNTTFYPLAVQPIFTIFWHMDLHHWNVNPENVWVLAPLP